MRATLPKLMLIGALAGFLAAWSLAIELAAFQGTLPLRWVIVAPLDPEMRSFTLATMLSAAALSVAWYWMEGSRLRPHRVSPRWYLKTVAWGLTCASLSAMLAIAPDVTRTIGQIPASLSAMLLEVVAQAIYGLVFGLPIVLVFSPVVVWIAEEIVLRG